MTIKCFKKKGKNRLLQLHGEKIQSLKVLKPAIAIHDNRVQCNVSITKKNKNLLNAGCWAYKF